MSDFQPIVSSNLEAARYDKKTRLLDVRFKGGAVYRYKRVLPGLYRKFEATFDGTKGSAGSFHAKFIRGLDNEKIEG